MAVQVTQQSNSGVSLRHPFQTSAGNHEEMSSAPKDRTNGFHFMLAVRVKRLAQLMQVKNRSQRFLYTTISTDHLLWGRSHSPSWSLRW